MLLSVGIAECMSDHILTEGSSNMRAYHVAITTIDPLNSSRKDTKNLSSSENAAEAFSDQNLGHVYLSLQLKARAKEISEEMRYIITRELSVPYCNVSLTR